MRLLIYNIRYGTGTGSKFHLPLPFLGYLRNTSANLQRITDFIKGYEPDIVGLIEVDSGSFRTDRSNQAEQIANALDHFHVYQGKYGSKSLLGRLPVFSKQVNAFLTSNEIRTPRFHYFREGVKRLVIELELNDLTVFLVHLSITFRHRHHQLRDLYALVKGANRPVIVAGDFNPLWGDTEMELFLAATGLRNANARSLPSFPSWMPHRQLDFILHSPNIRINRFEIPHIRLSDHLPLVCVFEVEPQS